MKEQISKYKNITNYLIKKFQEQLRRMSRLSVKIKFHSVPHTKLLYMTSEGLKYISHMN